MTFFQYAIKTSLTCCITLLHCHAMTLELTFTCSFCPFHLHALTNWLTKLYVWPTSNKVWHIDSQTTIIFIKVSTYTKTRRHSYAYLHVFTYSDELYDLSVKCKVIITWMIYSFIKGEEKGIISKRRIKFHVNLNYCIMKWGCGYDHRDHYKSTCVYFFLPRLSDDSHLENTLLLRLFLGWGKY